MTKRKPISKKLRFEVFKRDLFTCQYCGSKPPKSILEIDHIKPVSKGGNNAEDNLITSCFDCNRGKGANSLSISIKSIEEKLLTQKEKEEQMRAFEKMLSQKKALPTRRKNQLDEIFHDRTGYYFSDSFSTSVIEFLKKLPKEEVFNALDLALSRVSDPGSSLKYFCGICWAKIRERNYG